ncbi:MAG: hypothetical protein IJY51_09175 [Treponema sp.]|uniref:hypothetical protein n=1 Tax=Treponema sp. TaxID=166 RepID=UPI00257C1C76|nr:hypothetical protein [Treponema sp.]MBQ9103225.1 hypothetical protein [Treponema sp.]
MSDSKETNELDSYGVWVKNPPKTVDSSETSVNSDDAFNFDTDLPDFSDLDVIDEPSDISASDNSGDALSAEDLAGLEPENNSHSEDKAHDSPGSNVEEEISLDEFIEGGVFETGPDEDKIKEKEAEKAAAQAEQENNSDSQPQISNETAAEDDFNVTADLETETPEDAFNSGNSESASDDDIFNVDLSFDEPADNPAPVLQETSQNAQETSSADSPAGTQDVDLSEFGLDDLNFDQSDSSSETNAGNDGMESVDLSEFGFDDSDFQETEKAPESAENKEVPEIPEQKEPSLETENTPKQEIETINTEETIALEPEAEQSFEEEPQEPETSEAIADDDDFDLDSILDNITDETTGGTVSISDAGGSSKEPVENTLESGIIDEPKEKVSENTASETKTFAEPVEITPESGIVDEPKEEVSENTASQSETFAEPVEITPESEIIDEPKADAADLTEKEVEETEIPDTFDEEAASFLENDDEKVAEVADSITAPILDEGELETEKPSTQMTAIFSQIVTELSSLKNEIASLKNEFETLKNEKQPENLKLESNDSGNEGFFSNSDEDDTIALSKDEMDNILNTADIAQAEKTEEKESEKTEATQENLSEPEELSSEEPEFKEEPEATDETENLFGSADDVADISDEDILSDDDFAMEFESAQTENIEEPTLDDVDYTNISKENDLPEEISVPKNDDILVESSPTDLLETKDSENEGKNSSDSFDEDPFELSAVEPSISETLTDEKLDYLSKTPEEAEQNVNPEEVLELPESEETENAKENESAEEVETEKTEATQENISEPEELSSEEPETKESKDISDDLKTEIKSVLSYMDQLLENLPENKIAEFAQSEQFDTYKKLFKELGLA